MTSKKFSFFSFTALAIINIIVFFPSFFHTAKADQLLYLIEVADLDTFVDLFNYTIGHNRTRLIFAGDYIYFRPIFYLGMTLERYFFKYTFMYWQIVGVLLHLIVVGVSIRLFNQIRPNKWMSVLFALFFSLIYLSADMVTWYHMNMYIVCYIFVLFSLIHMIRYIQDEATSHRSLRAMIIYLILACLTNEFGVVACFLIMLVTFFCRKPKLKIKNHPGLLFIPIVLYFYMSILDFRMRLPNQPFFDASVGTPDFLNIGSIITHFLQVLSMGVLLPFCPGFFNIHPGERNYLGLFTDKNIFDTWPQFQVNVIFNGIILLMIAGFLIIVFRNRKKIFTGSRLDRPESKDNCPIVLGATSFLLVLGYVFAFIISRGTSNSYNFYNYLSTSVYHFYPICLFLTITGYCVFSIIDQANFPDKKTLQRAVVIILCSSALLNASRLYDLNTREKNMFHVWGVYIQNIESFVQAHKHEPDFSFDIRNPVELRRPFSFLIGHPSDQKEVTGFPSEFLFRKYINKVNPKYTFSFTINGR